MQTTLHPKRTAKKIAPPSNFDPQDRTTLIAFYVMMGSLVVALVYFLLLPFVL